MKQPNQQRTVKTATQRRQESHNLLSSIDFPVHGTQALLPEEDTFELRPAYEIANYIVTAAALYCVQNDPEFRGELRRHLEHTALWRTVLARQERRLENTDFINDERMDLSWHLEALNLLLWTLGQECDVLLMPSEQVDQDEMHNKITSILAQPQVFMETAVVRPLSLILDVLDLHVCTPPLCKPIAAANPYPKI